MKLISLRLPLVYAILALISHDKVSIFYDKFLSLMEWLIVSSSNGTEEEAQYAAYVIDQMHMNENLDMKKHPNRNLVDIFIATQKDKEVIQEYQRSK